MEAQQDRTASYWCCSDPSVPRHPTAEMVREANIEGIG